MSSRVLAESRAALERLIRIAQRYPEAMGYSKQFDAIVRAWRPALAHRADAGSS
jgi:hypothetical protein